MAARMEKVTSYLAALLAPAYNKHIPNINKKES